MAIEAPGEGPGHWAGAPSVVADDGLIYLAYRLRRPVGKGRGFAVVVARSEDGERFEPVLELGKDEYGTESFERPALVRGPGGEWRLYVSSATAGTLHWRVDLLEAADPSGFDPARRRPTLTGDAATALKDPVVTWADGKWHLWICCHAIAVPADADRMFTRYGTSADGVDWDLHGIALAGRQGCWDSRGARITSVLRNGTGSVAYYDGRASAEQNWEELTGYAVSNGDGAFHARGDRPAAVSPNQPGGLRYLDVLPLPDGSHRLYYEATREDGAHDLRTEYVPPPR